MPSPKHRIAFHFDFLSPYAYLAWHALQKLEQRRRDVVIVPTPTVLAALLNAAGQKGPAEIPAKRPYVFKDAVRGAKKVGVPLTPPPSHPFHPLLPLRVVCAAAPTDKAAVVSALFGVAWGGDRFDDDAAGGLDQPAVVLRALGAVGIDSQALVDAAATPEIKLELRANTDAAIAAGHFGVPTMVVGDELFWGFDSLDYVEWALDGEDPAATIDVDKWAKLPATATR